MALHKLYLNPAPRYSEDVDLVQVKLGAIQPIMQRIGEVVTFFEEKKAIKSRVTEQKQCIDLHRNMRIFECA